MKYISGMILMFGIVFIVNPMVSAGESPAAVLKEAKELYKKADKMQGAWITTGKLIKKSEEALKKGQNDKALKLAEKARIESKLSIALAEDQMNNWSEPPYIGKR